MNVLKAAIGDAVSAVYGSAAPLWSNPSGRVLMYHAVGGMAAGDLRGIYSIAPEAFAAHIRCLADTFGSQFAALDNVVAHGAGYALTFDDGYRDNLTVAAPQLSAASLPFTVFVTLDFIDSGEPQYLSRAELKELAGLPGVTIGTHGRSHRALTQLNDLDLADELYRSKSELEDLIGQAVSSMSYPYGAFDVRVRAAAQQAGYAIAACSRFGGFRKGDDPLTVPRIDIWADDGLSRLLAKTRGHWDWMGWRA